MSRSCRLQSSRYDEVGEVVGVGMENAEDNHRSKLLRSENFVALIFLSIHHSLLTKR